MSVEVFRSRQMLTPRGRLCYHLVRGHRQFLEENLHSHSVLVGSESIHSVLVVSESIYIHIYSVLVVSESIYIHIYSVLVGSESIYIAY